MSASWWVWWMRRTSPPHPQSNRLRTLEIYACFFVSRCLCSETMNCSSAASSSAAARFTALSAMKCSRARCASASRAAAYRLAPFPQPDCRSRSARRTASLSFTIFRTVLTRTWSATFSATFSVLRLLPPTPSDKFLLIQVLFSWVFARGSLLLLFRCFSVTWWLLRRRCVTWVFEFLLLFQ